MRAYTRKYSYDKLGNIQQMKQLGTNAFTRDYNYGSGTDNMLESVDIGSNSYSYTYDACGNQTVVNSNRRFDWDAANRLLFFRDQVGTSQPTVEAQYLYDGAGNRVKKIVRKSGGIYEIRVYIEGVFEYYTDETDEQNTIHIMDDKSRIAKILVGDAMGEAPVQYVLDNNIGSSMVLLAPDRSIVNVQEYYPFGETSFGCYGKKRYQYVGKERDEESGMYYYGARYYSPWIGRFISVDPLAADYPFYTPYNYAGNKPINKIDIDGMQEEGAATAPTNGGNAANPTTGANGTSKSNVTGSSEGDVSAKSANGKVETHSLTGEKSLLPKADNVYDAPERKGVDYEGKADVHYGRLGNADASRAFYSGNPNPGTLNEGTSNEMQVFWNPDAKSNVQGAYFYQKAVPESATVAEATPTEPATSDIETPVAKPEPTPTKKEKPEPPVMNVPVNISEGLQIGNDYVGFVEDFLKSNNIQGLVNSMNSFASEISSITINVQIGEGRNPPVEWQLSNMGFNSISQTLRQMGLSDSIAIQRGQIGGATPSGRVIPGSSASFRINSK